MSETLTFGPEWLRALSSGNSVTSPPPSPGPKYKLAEHRYGKEEMLALFNEEVKIPEELEMFESVCRSRPVLPLAFQPLTEEEQRNAVGSVNSNAVLKLMGRGGTRGAGAPRGAGRGGLRGRGRGDGGYVRQTSYEETRGEGGGGFGRGMDTRRQGWNETSGRGGFERSPSLRESAAGPSGPGRGGYDPALFRPRLSSDTSWERPERRSDSGNWRSGGAAVEDDDGWRISGQKSSDRSEKWRGGLTRGRGCWRGGPEMYRERGSHPDEEWQTARGGRRSYHDQEDVRWGTLTERLPEWSNNDSDDLNTLGTFDSSGAFVSQKQKEEKERSKDGGKSDEQKENTNKSRGSQSESDSSLAEDPDVWKEDDHEDDIFSDTGTKDSSELETLEAPTVTQQPPATTEQAQENFKTPSPPSVSPSTMTAEPHSEVAEPSNTTSISDVGTLPVMSQEQHKEEEPNMDHFAQAAENLVASLDNDEEDDVKTSTQSKEFSKSPRLPEDVQWSYTDPQGKVQGPFTNSEMADWFSHGYFTMGLLVKRTTDDAFQPLGEVIKQWGRVPFIPGPQPPPFKGVPEHIHRQQQQQLIAQQQYQHLMQQHYIQQQLFHQQALMIQQQQIQHNQQQMQQVPQSSQHSSSQNASPPGTQQLQPQSTQGRVSPGQPPSRPQGLSPHTESIWGSNTPQQTTSAVISPGPWSPGTTSASSKGWDRENSQQNVPSFEEIQRLEEEKEKQALLEAERREASARALRLKQEEEERRRLQEAAMLKKQQEEEERRRHEEAERRRKEQEELKKKQQEEARMKQEEEMRRKQEQQEALRKQEQQRKQLEIQKQNEEQKRINELRRQQQEALSRLQQQQQELLKKNEMQQKAERQQRELQHKLQQKRQESQASGGSLWGSSPVSGPMSLLQIQQQQEERERKQRELQLQQLRAQQQREQQAKGNLGWADRPVPSNQPVKSLLQIQQEQAQQLDNRQHRSSLNSRSRPSHNPLSSSVWGNAGGSLSPTWGAGNKSGNIWGTSPSKPPQPSFIDDDDDDSGDDSNGDNFWDDAVKAASKQRPPLQQRQQQSLAGHQLHNKMAVDTRPSRDEENLRRLFHQHSCTDEFSQWCEQALRSITNSSTVSNVHIPTFSELLKEVESPYEVYDYVKMYLGDSRETREFAREFIERRKKYKEKTPVSVSGFPQASVWGVPVPRGPSLGRPAVVNQSGVLFTGHPQEDPQDAMNKKKRKKKMQKVDPSILGFSVNAADRVNMGEIQTVED